MYAEIAIANSTNKALLMEGQGSGSFLVGLVFH